MIKKCFLFLISFLLLPIVVYAAHLSPEEKDQQELTKKEEDKKLNSEYAQAVGLPATGQPVPLMTVLQNIQQEGNANIREMATLKLSSGLAYLKPPHSVEFLRRVWGLPPNSKEEGVLFFGPPSITPDAPYGDFAEVLVNTSGHVDVPDMTELDIDELFKRIELPNRLIIRSPIEEVHAKWYQKPTYNPTTHQLIWGIKITNSKLNKEQSAHFFAGLVVLGRNATITFMHDGEVTQGEDELKFIMTTLANIGKEIEFSPGLRYENYVLGDPVASDDAMDLIAPSIPNGFSRFFSNLGDFLGQNARVLSVLLIMLTLVTGRLLPKKEVKFKVRKIISTQSDSEESL